LCTLHKNFAPFAVNWNKLVSKLPYYITTNLFREKDGLQFSRDRKKVAEILGGA
jgi:16S rRNA A1518/A1519 N6-dimethyltransferase RsmA/KsgA/DIM1 with predicted DNA glycosylase/AP lyase activity